MALSAGAVIARFKADLTNLKDGINNAKSALGDLKGNVGRLNESFSGFMNTAKVIGAVGVGAFTLFAKSALDLKNETDKANISLEIMAERFGHNAKTAKELANTLGKELRIGTGSASEGLQNLIKSGLTLEQSADMLRRFTNEALTGKSESISLSDAVKNLSFAYATNNSALGNLSGVNENFSDIVEKGKNVLTSWNGKANEKVGITAQLAEQIKAYEKSLKSQGKTLTANDDEMAKYVGMLQLTNLTAGSSARFTGTFTDNMAQLGLKITEAKLALGTFLQNALNPLIMAIGNSGIIENIERMFRSLNFLQGIFTSLASGDINSAREALFNFINTFVPDDERASQLADGLDWLLTAITKLGEWIVANQESILMFFKGMAIALGALLIIGTVIGLLNLLFNPITLIVLAIGALFVAWQNNFLGIRDLTDALVQFVIAIFESLKKFWANWGGIITSFFKNLWDVVSGIFQLAFSLIQMLAGVFIGLLTGDWKKAGEVLKEGAKNAWDAIVKIISGAFGAIMDGLNAFVKQFTDKLDGLFNKAREIGGKIKEALQQMNPFHKSSPSLVEYVQMGTAQIAKTYEGLADTIAGIDFRSGVMSLTGADLGSQLATQPAGAPTVNQNITMNVRDQNDAEFINGRLAFLYRNSNL